MYAHGNLPSEAKGANFQRTKVGQLQLQSDRGALAHAAQGFPVSLPRVAALKAKRYSLSELAMPDHAPVHEEFETFANTRLHLLRI